MNEMRQVEVEKVVLNIGVGGPGEDLENAKNLLQRLVDREPKETKSEGKNEFGTSKGREIGVMLTLRDEEAVDFLDKVFTAKGNEIDGEVFDDQGNFSIGVEEHVDIPGTEYDPDIGILGLDVSVTLERPGFRIKKKRISKDIGENHKITREDAINFVEEKFDVNVVS